MTFLPVVERELRVASRRRGTYWGRFVAAVVGAALVAWVLLTSDQSIHNIGTLLFQVVSTVVFLYAAVVGTLVTCDCLSVEKREGTLGLLFLTDLKGHDVVLGKLVATSVNAFYGMLAVLPMLAIPFLLGAVSHAEMLRVVLVAINLLLFFLSIGIFVSALCHKDNWSLGLSILIALLFVAGGPIASQFKTRFATAEMLSSPVSCFLAFEENYTAQPHGYFWTNVAVTQLYSWIFFGLACWIVPRSWQDKAVGKSMPWRRKVDPMRRARKRAELLGINPFLWRVRRSGRKIILVWLTLAVLTICWGFSCWNSPTMRGAGVDLLLLIPAGLILKVWLAAEGSRTFSEDRRNGGMELLLTTPLHEKEIIRGQMLSMWRQFAWPVAAILLANFFFVLTQFRQWDADSRSALLKIHLLLGGFLVADMIALSWDSAWLGLINRRPNRAALLAVTRILVLPFVGFIVLLSMRALLTQRSGWEDSFENTLFVLWLLPALAADFYFGLNARAKLRSEFRTIVSEGLAHKRPNEPAAKAEPALVEAQ